MHLIEGIYEKLYRQKLLYPDSRDWALALIHNTEVTGLQESDSSSKKLIKLQLKNTITGENSTTSEAFDMVVAATGYRRNPFLSILEELKPLLLSDPGNNSHLVQRNYRVLFQPGSVVRDAGVWLQGSCENSHGVSLSQFFIVAHPRPR